MVQFGNKAKEGYMECGGELPISQLYGLCCRTSPENGQGLGIPREDAHDGGRWEVLWYVAVFESLGFSHRPFTETGWRKAPSHQGGFLLDGGVHFTAGLRLMLGPANPLVSLSANTTQLQEHLPPVDTVDATLKTKGGATGTFSVSFGSSFTGSEWTVACEKGVVSVARSTVTVGDEAKEVEDEKTGVPPEVRKWGEALANGTQNERQLPEEALADLELLEMMLRSGETGGSPQELTLQTW